MPTSEEQKVLLLLAKEWVHSSCQIVWNSSILRSFMSGFGLIPESCMKINEKFE